MERAVKEACAPAHRQDKKTTPPPPPLPPSSSDTSPSHEFSFTISFHPPLASSSPPNTINTTSNTKSSPPPAASAADLAPADDIFLRGHLLPLHHQLPPPASPPRPSDITFENFSLAGLDHVDMERSLKQHQSGGELHQRQAEDDRAGRRKDDVRPKTKSFSSFFGLGKLQKRNANVGNGEVAKEVDQDAEAKKGGKKKKGFNVSRLLKKYASMVEPLFFFKGDKEKEKRELRRRPCSFSGDSTRKEQEQEGRQQRTKEQFSAPDSTRTSRDNSGILTANSAVAAFASSDNSTMEELQSAIQAAIAHCKKSVASKQQEHCK
ncbi:hypothetical protein Cni_G15298 [Canna indica]|uniref:BRI1 kinase inhibitor 1 n=1 Tax=Canna indica TaxID=4628 RepID=A0AAQ3KD49_9LILI|nr:hypothetical protein Cni_G15298 [Canna indica]